MKWIKVEDQLPRQREVVIVIDSVNEMVSLAKFKPDSGFLLMHATDLQFNFTITHWMPFPIFRKDEEVSRDGWISLKDRKPKNNQLVKLKSDDLWRGSGRRQGENFIYENIKGACCGAPTHWMPIISEEKDDSAS